MKVSWMLDSVRVEHVEAKLLVTRTLGAEWNSEKVHPSALAHEKQRLVEVATAALRNLYDHKFRQHPLRTKR